MTAGPRTHPLPERTEASAPPVLEVDLYGAVHKGLRLALTTLILRMARTDAQDARSVEAALDELDGLLDLCEAHAKHEDAHLHRALEQRHAGGSAWAAREHERQRDQVAGLRALMARTAEADSAERPRCWRGLQLRYAAFVGENLVHMSDEEERLQGQLDALYTPDELRALHRRLVESLTPEQIAAFMGPMLEAASPREREALRAMAPGAR